MRLAIFDGHRLGVVRDEAVLDVTAALPSWDDGYAANWWLRLCHDFAELRPRLEAEAARAHPLPLASVRLRAPVLHPEKIVAAASNYAAHVQEMAERAPYPAWMLEFGVFLKAPSSIIGPEETVHLPPVGDAEVHHESELGVVIGRTGRHIPAERALDHVLGYTGVLDITVRGLADRSTRKSYDGFTPIGPWLVTADEVGDPQQLRIRLWVGEDESQPPRQDVNTRDMLVPVPELIAYASRIMTLHPGDVIATGAPPGVGQIVSGDVMTFEIERIGRMRVRVA